MSSADELRTRLETMQSHIETACAQAAEGRVMDVSALKSEAERLCNEILRLPPPAAREFQIPIGALIGSLDRLEHLLLAVQGKGNA